MTRQANIRQADVTRAIKGAQLAGLDVDRVEVNRATGVIVIVPKGSTSSPANEWDSVLKVLK
jgi:hypothetical protein